MRFIKPLFLMFATTSFSFRNLKHIANHYPVTKNIDSTKLNIKKDKTRFSGSIYKPKNENQVKYVNYLNNDTVNIVVSVGPAGTGKTMFACIKAIHLLKSGSLNKIVITRPIVAVEEEELGFLPGNLVKKMDPWTRPIMDIFMEYYSKTELDHMIYSNIIEISPLAYMRGRTFKNAFIIADEMQNSSPNQMLMLTTRIGCNSKLVITGDLKQVDKSMNENGLQDFINKVKKYKRFYETHSIELIEFFKHDIERSEIVQKVIDLYEFKEPNNLGNVNNIAVKTKNLNIENDAALIPLRDSKRT